jgi:hypothetical protein
MSPLTCFGSTRPTRENKNKKYFQNNSSKSIFKLAWSIKRELAQ